jgi:hypothetical protein
VWPVSFSLSAFSPAFRVQCHLCLEHERLLHHLPERCAIICAGGGVAPRRQHLSHRGRKFRRARLEHLERGRIHRSIRVHDKLRDHAALNARGRQCDASEGDEVEDRMGGARRTHGENPPFEVGVGCGQHGSEARHGLTMRDEHQQLAVAVDAGA